MKKATRLIAVLMLLCLVCCSFAACDPSEEETSSKTETSTDTKTSFLRDCPKKIMKVKNSPSSYPAIAS